MTTSLLDVLELEQLDRDVFRAAFVRETGFLLYGGQVAAQALLAAGRTVPEGCAPHSLHGYFLRRGDSTQPVVLYVDRDRDGRTSFGRRVVAQQDGAVIFSMSASFSLPSEGPEGQLETMPEVTAPEVSDPYSMPPLLAFEGRMPDLPGRTDGQQLWPPRYWARSTVAIPIDPLLQACAVTYLSDMSSGMGNHSGDHLWPGASLDHALWFHEPVDLSSWVLTDLVLASADRGRAFYTGTMWQDGRLVASLAQENLVMTGPNPYLAARRGADSAR
jgi:acyl-CoA thioesterase-2